MIYQYELSHDEGYDGFRQEFIYSNIKFEPKEFLKIVREAAEKIRENEYGYELIYEVKKYLLKNDNRFFEFDNVCIVDVGEDCYRDDLARLLRCGGYEDE